ncbi:MAG TPA: nucleotide exchange factor GrpE [Thermoflexales bacterium]|jgi:molecular chaperone GrpE|nr:nucleotide exchange factor GrpE [Thermoflexales bacterium]HQX10359.1 nucleotide exchange factor GrpE [Thermoflexales bacterium]HQY25944.1 nucleotide exchange factor GrpE [Thermoflexales bacterium]HQZ52194.1 nucleotide exchange factor GrpE [Thermoflexales bacterium]HRA54052.1 nucleotide exchange factor GrpE [Thermoflexales bacterium]
MDTTEVAPETEAQPNGQTPVTSEDPPAAFQAELDGLRRQLTEAQAEAAKNKDGWLRAVAEFSNFKKRQEADAANIRAYATLGLISKLLPVLDDFNRAVKTLPETLQHMTWIGGVMLIARKMQAIVESEGVKAVEVSPNDAFDPNTHEAVSHDDADGVESGHVIEELQRGYKLGDRVLRPALVRVAK